MVARNNQQEYNTHIIPRALPHVEIGSGDTNEYLDHVKSIVNKVGTEQLHNLRDLPKPYIYSREYDCADYILTMEKMDSLALNQELLTTTIPSMQELDKRLLVEKAVTRALGRYETDLDNQRTECIVVEEAIKNELTRRVRANEFSLNKLHPIIAYYAVKQGSPIPVRTPSGRRVEITSTLGLDIPNTHKVWLQMKICKDILHTKKYSYHDMEKPGTFMYGLQLGFLPLTPSTICVRFPSYAHKYFTIGELTPWVGT